MSCYTGHSREEQVAVACEVGKNNQPLDECFLALTLDGISSSDEGGISSFLSGGGRVSSVGSHWESNLFRVS